ncbi:hypothetical protein GCM10010274_25520 [Streptomyces lavendofoliae]|uniref:Uncharacterized protein n=1 Tax=Streptomyces lavendofoliae TaxID=67314 RepID=A0A918HWB3_9ACTN|nr:hypothetical protein [Streptomyces lavendofoliae]GGU36934.1 hypothetical protein GCM10010274_25520 [Streptomyces lavendofoliae]
MTPPEGRQRKQVLLRLDPGVYEALARWAADELRSANSQIEFLLRKALSDAGRLPSAPAPLPRRGRPPKTAPRTAPSAPPNTAQDPPEAPTDGPSGRPRTPPGPPK